MKKTLCYYVLFIIFITTISIEYTETRTLAYRQWLPQATDSVRWYLMNGTAKVDSGLADADSIVNQRAIFDIVVNDTVNYLVNMIYYYDNALYPASCDEQVNAVVKKADLDSLILAAGYKIGAWSKSYFSKDSDTLVVGAGATIWFKVIYYHIGGYPGSKPDSTKTLAP